MPSALVLLNRTHVYPSWARAEHDVDFKLLKRMDVVMPSGTLFW